jgi:putative ABC transport system permease protein
VVGIDLIGKSLWRDRGLFGLWIACLCVSVSGLLVVDVFRHSLENTLTVQGRKILTADVAVSSRRVLSETERATVKKILPADAKYSDTMDLFAMISHEKAGERSTHLASVHFIDDAFPLIGDLQIQASPPAGPSVALHGHDLGETPQAWIASDFVTLLNVTPGDELQIGQTRFKIAGVISKDSSQTFRFGNMAARIYIHRRYLQPSGLVQFGSTFSQTLLAELPAQSHMNRRSLEAAFPDTAVQITTPEDLQQGSLRVMSRLLDFLGLTGLVTLCLGWIGVYYLGRRWLSLEASACGILKCLGYSSRDLRRLLLIKLSVILVTGVAAGGALAWILAARLMPVVRDSLPEEFALHWSWQSSLLLLLIGPISGLVLLYPPLRALNAEPPLDMIQGTSAIRSRWSDLLQTSLVVVALFVLITVQQARSWTVSLYFFGGLLGVLLIVAGSGYLLLRLAELCRRGFTVGECISHSRCGLDDERWQCC